MHELITLGSLALGSEVLAFVLRRLRDRDIQQRLKRLALTFARALSLLFILGLLVSLMWASTISIYSALALALRNLLKEGDAETHVQLAWSCPWDESTWTPALKEAQATFKEAEIAKVDDDIPF